MRSLKVPRIFVTLNPGKAKSVPQAIAHAKSIASSIAANPAIFKAPNPPIATFNAQISAAEAAQAATLTRAAGTVEARDVAMRALDESCHIAQTYVESIANADPGSATATIAAAGMTVRKARSSTKQQLAVKQGPISGSVTIVAKSAGSRSVYSWQFSLDQKSWTDLPQTIKAKTLVVGLQAGVVTYFRFRVLNKAGLSDYSQVVSLHVT